MKQSRTANSTKNIKYSIISTIISYTLSFATRTIFIYYLTTEFLGMNALITSVLSILSLVEAGLGGTFQVMLFKPLSEDNYSRVLGIVHIFRKIFRIIAVVTFLGGMAFLPIINLIIEISNFKLFSIIYLFAILGSSINYIVLPDRVLIQADQKKYVIIAIDQIGVILQYTIQILILILTQNFILYSLAQFISIVITAILKRCYSSKNYKSDSIEKLDDETKKDIKVKTYAGFMHHLGFIVNNGTDSIFISAFIGLDVAGIYSNYLLILNVIKSLLLLIFDSIYSSLGNKISTDSVDDNFILYKKTDYIGKIIVGFSAVAFFILLNPFVILWIGIDYTFPLFTMFLIVWVFYVDYNTSRKTINMFKKSTGLFEKDKYISLIEAAINIIITLILVKPLGINGILIGRIASYYLTVFWTEPLLVFKYYFNKDLTKYFFAELRNLLKISITGTILYFLVQSISLEGIVGFIIKVAIVGIIGLGLIILPTIRTKEFKFYKNEFKRLVFKKKFK